MQPQLLPMGIELVGGGRVSEVSRLKGRRSQALREKRVPRIFDADLSHLKAFSGEDAVVEWLKPVIVEMQTGGRERQQCVLEVLAR